MAQNPSKNEVELEQHIGELTADLQRIQADFINYRSRAEEDKQKALLAGKAATVLKLLPVIDNIERAVGHVPADLAENQWARGIVALSKSLEKSLSDLGVTTIEATGKPFDPNLHEALSAEGEGDHEVVAEELQKGYMLDGSVLRHSLVRVANQDAPASDPSEEAQHIVEDSEGDTEQADQVKGED